MWHIFCWSMAFQKYIPQWYFYHLSHIKGHLKVKSSWSKVVEVVICAQHDIWQLVQYSQHAQMVVVYGPGQQWNERWVQVDEGQVKVLQQLPWQQLSLEGGVKPTSRRVTSPCQCIWRVTPRHHISMVVMHVSMVTFIVMATWSNLHNYGNKCSCERACCYGNTLATEGPYWF